MENRGTSPCQILSKLVDLLVKFHSLVVPGRPSLITVPNVKISCSIAETLRFIVILKS